MSKAEELIACLEGEIAKRDARIAELESRIVLLECEAQVNAAPVSEAKAQGVVMPERKHTNWRAAAGHETPNHGWNACLDEVARLNAAPVQQVSVPASAFASRAITHYEAALLAAFPSGSSGEVFNQWNEARRVLNAAPAAPAADAPPESCRQRLAAEGKPYPRSSCAACGQFSPKWRECDAAIAAHRAKGVL